MYKFNLEITAEVCGGIALIFITAAIIMVCLVTIKFCGFLLGLIKDENNQEREEMEADDEIPPPQIIRSTVPARKVEPVEVAPLVSVECGQCGKIIKSEAVNEYDPADGSVVYNCEHCGTTVLVGVEQVVN